MPHNSTRQSVIDFDVFDVIQSHIAEFESESTNWYIISGDFNARTANNVDFIEKDDVSIHVPLPDNYVADATLPRSSQDKCVN